MAALKNIEEVNELRGLARAKARDYITTAVDPLLLEKYVAEGWSILKRNQKSVSLSRKKPVSTLLEDRVWTLLYRMGFLGQVQIFL